MNNETRKELREYAWNYFDIHAHQRLNVFSFFITLSTATIGGFLALLELIEEPSKWMAIIPFSLSFFSFIFWKLDKRTSMLVENGEAALKTLDAMLNHVDDAEGKPNVLAIFDRDDFVTEGLKRWPLTTGYFSYRRSFRWVFMYFGYGGFVIGGYCLYALA